MIDSIYEVEYIAAFDAVKQAMWLWKFIDELRVAPSIDGPILLYCDSTGAIAQAKKLSSISAPNIFCTATTLFERSWIEVMSIFRRLTEKKT